MESKKSRWDRWISKAVEQAPRFEASFEICSESEQRGERRERGRRGREERRANRKRGGKKDEDEREGELRRVVKKW